MSTLCTIITIFFIWSNQEKTLITVFIVTWCTCESRPMFLEKHDLFSQSRAHLNCFVGLWCGSSASAPQATCPIPCFIVYSNDAGHAGCGGGHSSSPTCPPKSTVPQLSRHLPPLHTLPILVSDTSPTL